MKFLIINFLKKNFDKIQKNDLNKVLKRKYPTSENIKNFEIEVYFNKNACNIMEKL